LFIRIYIDVSVAIGFKFEQMFEIGDEVLASWEDKW